MIAVIVGDLISAASELLSNLGVVFNDVIELFYDTSGNEPTMLGSILIGTAGFALAWAGVRFIFGFINRLLNKTRAGA
jgi:hypothetical protein